MNKNVIIVDDSKLSRMHLRGIVLRHRPDWSVSEAANASELFEELDKSSIHIAIIDYNMPGMNGLDAATEVRQRHPDVHIAMVTANAQDAVVAGIRALGAAFLPKPVDEEQIKHFLASTLLPRRPAAAP
ncbi:response regulator [Azospirillum sp.]|uniref:response regulator transcription factor n=1 Tax=Azospirillum sp. TaxID=34012 RepID=UPI002D56FE24|nr:response regulator [Azospirillum sp.]HYD64730.1 response regulator [Azospirillum sp.]